MPLDPQVIARAIQDEEKKGTEICTKLKTLLPMYKVLDRQYCFLLYTFKFYI